MQISVKLMDIEHGAFVFNLPIDYEYVKREIKAEVGVCIDECVDDLYIVCHDFPYEIPFWLSLLQINLLYYFFREIEGTSYERDLNRLLRTFGGYFAIIENFSKIAFYPNMTLEDLARRYCSEGKLGVIDERLNKFINYERLGYMLYNGKTMCVTDNGIYELKT